MNQSVRIIAGVTVLLLACNLMLVVTPPGLSTPIARNIPTLSMTQPSAPLPVPQHAPTSREFVTPFFTVSPIPTPTWITHGPGPVVVPILLYHRIAVSTGNSRYYVSPDSFKDQIELLHDWGYTSIGTELLVTAIQEGASLPPRPIIITFDDGNLDNYTAAFPTLKKNGFTGVLYIVAKYLGAPGYMDAAEIIEMAAAGWEVGSHSMTHRDLLDLDETEQQSEIRESKRVLEDSLGVPVQTFAYPFGSMDPGLVRSVYHAGYIAAVGTIDSTAIQDEDHLFYLRREEIEGQQGINSFSHFLPWQEE